MVKRIFVLLAVMASLASLCCSGIDTEGYLDGEFIEISWDDTTPPATLWPYRGDLIFNLQTILEWTRKNGANSYTVEIATDNEYTNHVNGSPLIVDSFQTFITIGPDGDISLPDGRTYYWRVRADTTPEGQYGTSYFEAMEDTVYVHCPAGEECNDEKCIGEGGADTYCLGNRSKPYKTIIGAMSGALSLRIYTIKVASRGSNEVYGGLSIEPGLTLRGGYGVDYNEATRDITGKPSIIESSNSSPVLITSIIEPTKLDGFVIRGTDSTGTTYGLIAVDSSSDVEVSNSVIQAGNSSTKNSYGIYTKNSGIQIYNCTISSGEGVNTYGIYVENGTGGSSNINGNSIHAANATSNSYGMLVNGYTVNGNTITAGSAGSSSYGMCCSVNSVVQGNSITSGNAIENSYGMYAYDEITMNNNTIHAGNSATAGSYGFFYQPNHTICYPVLSKNRFFGGNGATSHGVFFGNDLGGSNCLIHPLLTNNIIVSGSSSGNNYGIRAVPSYGSIFLTMSNNILVTGIASGSNYVVYCGKTTSGSSAVINATLTNNILLTQDSSSIAGITNYYGTVTSNYNAIYLVVGTDYSGTILDKTGDVTENDPLLDENYQFQSTSPCLITKGASDLSAQFTDDINGTERTAPWSMGAFEWDGTCQ